MPNFKVHLLAGFFSGVLLSLILNSLMYSFSVQIVLVGLVFSSFFGLLPDFDKGDSKVNHFVTVVIICGAVWAMLVLSWVLLGLFLFLLLGAQFLTHRGLFHSVEVGVLLSLVLLFVVPVWGCFAFFGWCSHLVLDYFPKL